MNCCSGWVVFLFFSVHLRYLSSYWGKECVWGDSFYIKKNKISNKLILRILIKNFLYNTIHLYKIVRFLKYFIKKISR